jgi:hypothetical protein
LVVYKAEHIVVVYTAEHIVVVYKAEHNVVIYKVECSVVVYKAEHISIPKFEFHFLSNFIAFKFVLSFNH